VKGYFDEKNDCNENKDHRLSCLQAFQRMLPMKLVNEEALIVIQNTPAGSNIFIPAKVARLPVEKPGFDSSNADSCDCGYSVDQ
jgi:hypothetical protein